MQRLSNFLLKGRDFSDVQFGEITSDINMSGTQMHVSRMEVESTCDHYVYRRSLRFEG